MLKLTGFEIDRPITEIDIENDSDAIYTILRLEKEVGFGYREIEILKDLKTIEINHDTPQGYHILKFYDSNGCSFEAGQTPNGYKITN